MGNEILELVVTIAWSIWFNRNVIRQRKTRQSTVVILHKARMLLEEFQTTNHQSSKHIVKDSKQWTNPTRPWYKINVDGMTF